jgi:hypothetical protein
MPCTLLGLSSDACAPARGGVSHFYVTSYDAITGITIGTGANAGVITGFTMSASGLWKKFVPQKNQTAFFNQTGERPNEFSNTHRYVQELFAQFSGIDKARLDAINALKDCCQLVAIVVLANGARLVLGLEADTTAAGNRVPSIEGDCRATVSALSDTAANEARVEVRITARSANASPTTNLTDAAIEAL